MHQSDNGVIELPFKLQVLFNEAKEAIGVEYERHGTILEAYARNEVVLSAGTVRSAQILLLSGIGPSRHLKSLKVGLMSNDAVHIL